MLQQRNAIALGLLLASCSLALGACGSEDDPNMMTFPTGTSGGGGAMPGGGGGMAGGVAGMNLPAAGNMGVAGMTPRAGTTGTAGAAGMSGMGGMAGAAGRAGSAGGTAGSAGSAGSAGAAGGAGTAGRGGMGGNAGGSGMGGMGGAGAAATFTEVYAIIMMKCGGGASGCHVTGGSGMLRMPNKAMARMALVGVASEECQGEMRVVAGNAANSTLIKAIEGTACVQRMPQGRAALTADEIAKFKSWVNAGAMDN
jgi:hypothetical protein